MANSWQSLFELGKGYEIISFEVCGYSYFPFFLADFISRDLLKMETVKLCMKK